MTLVYVAIALFSLIIVWLALQPKQGSKASNAPDPDDITHQLPKPQVPSDVAQASPTASQSNRPRQSHISYELPDSETTPPRTKEIHDPKVQDELKSLVRRSRNIEALKLVRATTGWGLKRSKEYLHLLSLGKPEIESADDLDVKEQVRMLMQTNQKIQAIKLVRSTTGWGLKESKEYVEQFPNLGPLPSLNPTISNNISDTVESFDIDRHDINDRIQLLMQTNQKIQAIKLVRTVTNWGLKESKEYIERYPDLPPLPVIVNGPVSSQIQQLLSEQQYMDAIHLVEKKTGMLVSEAKEYIEQNFDFKFPF